MAGDQRPVERTRLRRKGRGYGGRGAEEMARARDALRIRRVREGDAERVAELSGQLGYPAGVKEMKRRLRDVLKDKDAACFVAEAAEGGVIGWIHVSVTPLLEVERRAEVNGLVVDERARSRGAGAIAAGGGGEVGERETVQGDVGAVERDSGTGARVLCAGGI